MLNRLLILICQKVEATGSGIVVREIAQQAAARGIEVMVLCGAHVTDDPHDWFSSDQIHVRAVRFGSKSQDSLPFDVVGMSNQMPYPSSAFVSLTGRRLQLYMSVWRKHIAQAVADFKPCLAHVHHLWLLAHLMYHVAPKVPVVVSVHGTDLHRAEDAVHIRSIIGPSFQHIRRFVALTHEAIRRACDRYDLDESRFAVLGNGFNQHIFHPQKEVGAPPWRGSKAPSSGDRPIVLFVGKFALWKGVPYLIRAISRVQETSNLKPILWVVGSGPNEVRESYMRLTADEGIDDVLFLGQLTQHDVAAAMNVARVFVLPSFEEPFGLSLLEAMACGCRVIAANQSGPAEFIPGEARNLGYARLIGGLDSVEPNDQEASRYIRDLAEAIEYQLRQPFSYLVRQQISATVQNFTWDRYFERLLELYEECNRDG